MSALVWYLLLPGGRVDPVDDVLGEFRMPIHLENTSHVLTFSDQTFVTLEV